MTDGTVQAVFDKEHPHILLVTIDRAPVNAMSLDTYRMLGELFEGLVDRPEVHCVILTGAGERAFVAGADVKALSQRTPASTAARGRGSRRIYEAIYEAPVPVIAAVNGPALGAGFIIASVCDFIIASERATFALPEIDVGALGGSRHIARVLPEKIMRRLVLTGDRVDGNFLHRHGVVHQVVPHEQLIESSLTLAARLAAKSRTLMRMRKTSLNLVEEMPVREGYRVEQLYTSLASHVSDATEGARAVAEKRAPEWADEKGPVQ